MRRHKARPRTRFADDVVQEAVRIYVQGLAPYRTLVTLLERRIGRSISRQTLNRWVDELGGRAKTPLQMSAELRPHWGGFLGVDGKAIQIAGRRYCLMIGVDHPSFDVVHALVAPSENGDSYAQLITEARLDAHYPLLGVVADLGSGFVEAHRDHFGSLPFQACRVHFDRRLERYVPRLVTSPNAALGAELRERIRAVLYAPTHVEAGDLRDALFLDRAHYAQVHRHHDPIRSLQMHFGLYMTHHFTLGLPADNNATENVVKQLNKKLRLMEGFASVGSAERFIRLLVGCYRLKRFSDSARRQANGKAPLELAGVDLKGKDWLSVLLDRTHSM